MSGSPGALPVAVRALAFAAAAAGLAALAGAGPVGVASAAVAGLLLERLLLADLAGRVARGIAAARVLARANGPARGAFAETPGERRATSCGAEWDDYAPVGATRRTVVVVHGVTVLGPRDPRLVRFARSLCAAGFHVAAPALEGLRRFEADPADAERVRAVVRACAAADGAPVAVVGFSLGAGVALAAAAPAVAGGDPPLRGHVSLLLLLGAHDTLAPLFEDARAPAEPPWDGDDPRALDGVLYLRCLRVWRDPAGAGLAAEDEAALGDLLGRWCVAADAAEKRRFWDERLAGRPLPPPAATPEALAALSPAGRLATLDAPVILLHDRDDPVVPPAHARRLLTQLAARGPGHRQRLLVTPILDHVAARDLWRLHDLVRVLASFGALFERDPPTRPGLPRRPAERS